jgi:hypothetical protein
MGFVKQGVEAIGGMLSGEGPASMGPGRIQGGAFQDPYREENKKLLEEQRKAQEAVGTQGLAGQTQVGQQQQQLIAQMQQRALGQAPSIAELQMGRGMDLTRQALASQAASQRGAGAGLAQRNLARATAGTMQEQAAQGGMLRAQEQAQAEQALAGTLGQTRAQDQALMMQANQLAQQYVQMGMNVDQAQFLANQQLEQMRQQARMAQAQTGAQQQAALLQAGSTIAAGALMSDVNQKENIKSGDKDVSKFLKAISAKSYDYKDGSLPGAAQGKRYGIIAQDLEKSEMGKSLVQDTAHGKMVNVPQSVGALLAAVSHLNKRLEKMER